MSEEQLFALLMDTKERVKMVEDEIPKQDWKDHVTNSIDFLVGKYSKFEQEFDLMSHRTTAMSERLDRMDDDIQAIKKTLDTDLGLIKVKLGIIG